MSRVGATAEHTRDESFDGVSVREEYETKFRKSLVERAKKRLPDVRGAASGDQWLVAGRSKFGDAHKTYHVHLNDDGKYRCTCYDTNHGASRARRMCSHVLAVILWRKSRDSGEGGPGSTTATMSEVGDDTPSSEPLDPRDPALTPRSWEPPPEWLKAYRPHQWQAALEIVKAFEAGAKVVYADAPTGSGKGVMADLVARLLKSRAIYVCTSLQLQDQLLRELPYARVIRGRANYPTLNGPSDVTADDCDGDLEADDCTFCDPMAQCPYRVAKQVAIRAQVAVLNTAYWLREANYVGAFSRGPKKKAGDDATESTAPAQGLVIIDECDTLESMLLGFIEFNITPARLRQLGLEPPPPKSHYSTIAKWLKDHFQKALAAEMQRQPNSVVGKRRARALGDLAAEGLRVAREIRAEKEDDEDGDGDAADEKTGWVRDNSSGPLTMKPITVAPYGPEKVWGHATRVLMMSGTIVSVDELQASLGQHEPAAVVRVPMTFPVENRPIYAAPVANVTNSSKEEAWPLLAHAIQKIGERHPGERILVHTVAYNLCDYLTKNCSAALADQGRRTITYTRAQDRMSALEAFRKEVGGVLFAPSFDRGIDLAGEDCRVIVVAKCPFPYLGDAQVNARMRGREGQAWYVAQTIRSVVQMTGRAVRSEDDWCQCVTPGTLVLTDDLRWVLARKLSVSDGLLGFDEHTSRTATRKWRRATVEATGIEVLPRYRIRLASGEELITTPNHRWISRWGQARDDAWLRTDELRVGHHLNRYLNRWLQSDDYDVGWLAGFYDGEGCLSLDQGRHNRFVTGVQVSQKAGPILDKAEALLTKLGFTYKRWPLRSSDTHATTIQGGFAEHLRFLGQVRPERLLKKLLDGGLGQRMLSIGYEEVVAVEQIDDGPMVTLQSSTGTFIAEGFAAHNSYILDAQFTRNLYKKNRSLFPEWWREALVTDFPTRELL